MVIGAVEGVGGRVEANEEGAGFVAVESLDLGEPLGDGVVAAGGDGEDAFGADMDGVVVVVVAVVVVRELHRCEIHF